MSVRVWTPEMKQGLLAAHLTVAVQRDWSGHKQEMWEEIAHRLGNTFKWQTLRSQYGLLQRPVSEPAYQPSDLVPVDEAMERTGLPWVQIQRWTALLRHPVQARIRRDPNTGEKVLLVDLAELQRRMQMTKKT